MCNIRSMGVVLTYKSHFSINIPWLVSVKIWGSLENSQGKFTGDYKAEISEIESIFSKFSKKKKKGSPDPEAYATSSVVVSVSEDV